MHVTGKGGEMKVWLSPLSVEFSYGFSPPEQRKIMNVIVKNADLFVEAWHEFSCKKK